MIDLKLSNEEILQITKLNNTNEEFISQITDTIFELSVLAYKALNNALKFNKNDE